MEKRLINFSKQTQSLKFLAIFVMVGIGGCSGQSSISARYLTAEKLWSEKKYEASVVEFDRVIEESPGSAIALQSLWRASMTRALFLKRYPEALKGLNYFIEHSAQREFVNQAKREVGEILFNKTQKYEAAIEHYQKLIDSKEFPMEETAQFLYRISRAYVFTGKIRKAIKIQEDWISRYSSSELNLKVKMDLAQNWFTIGDVEKDGFQKSLNYYNQVSNETRTRDRKKYTEAQFGKAMVLEELDQLKEAVEIYESIEAEYSVPKVVKLRIEKINERNRRKKI